MDKVQLHRVTLVLLLGALLPSSLGCLLCRGQEVRLVKDSLVYRQAASLDSSLVGRNILSVMPSRASGGAADVKVNQSQAISGALAKRIESNSSRKMQGYRIRIYFDNKQNSRTVSESVLARFKASHPGIPAYRTYVNPFFKVTVGNFRTKSEALQLLQSLKGEYPSAFVLKETIDFPVVDKKRSYVTDTVRVAVNITDAI